MRNIDEMIPTKRTHAERETADTDSDDMLIPKKKTQKLNDEIYMPKPVNFAISQTQMKPKPSIRSTEGIEKFKI